MKKIIFLFVFILIISIQRSSLCNTEKNDLERDELKGRVAEFTEKNHSIEYRPGKSIKKLVRTKITKYDSSGNRIDEQEYRYGAFFNKYIQRFNNTGNRKINTKYNPDNNHQSKYSNMGNTVTNTLDDSFYSKEIYKYNKNGDIIEWKSYKSNGSLFSKYLYKYDKNRNMIEDIFYGVDGLIKWKNIYNYDKNGKIKKKTVYKYNNLYSQYTFEYDIKGNMTAEACYLIKEGEEKLVLAWFNEYEYKYWEE